MPSLDYRTSGLLHDADEQWQTTAPLDDDLGIDSVVDAVGPIKMIDEKAVFSCARSISSTTWISPF